MKSYIMVSLVVMLLLAGCPGGGEKPCPEAEQLVCGVDGVTYTNPCFAHKAGVNVAYDGPCTGPPLTAECSDGDGGKDIFVAGSVLGADGQYRDDYCEDTTNVVEYFCKVDEVRHETLPCPGGYVCNSGMCIIAPCEDSDGGIKPGEQGTATSGTDSETDECEDEATLMEFFCKDGAIASEAVECPPNQHCAEGACVEFECEDSDEGEDPYEAGTVTKGEVSEEDSCSDPDTVKEYYCEDNIVKSKDMDCTVDEHCVEGVCVEKEECEDTDMGKDRYTQGTVTFEDESQTDACYSSDTVIEYFCEGTEISNVKLVCGIGYECSGGECVEQECEEDELSTDPQRYEIASKSSMVLFRGDAVEVEVGSHKYFLEVKTVNNDSAVFALYDNYEDYMDEDDVCDDEGVGLGDENQDICGEELDLDLDGVNDEDNFVEISTGESFNFVQYRTLEGTTYDGDDCPDDIIEEETSLFYPALGEPMEGDDFKMLDDKADIDQVDVESEELSVEFDGDDYDFEDGDTFEYNDVDYQISIDFENYGISRIIIEED